MNISSLSRYVLMTFAVTLTLVGCNQSAAPQPHPGPVEVSVVTIAPQHVELTTDLPGRTSPFRIAEVRPQVNGILQKRLFTEGDDVKEGQQLYQIDPSVYQAAYDSAQATLAHAKAARTIAQLTVDRYKQLTSTNAVSKQDYDNSVATLQQAEADVASGEAAVESARVNLAYTKVFSPISGRTGRSVTEGALLTASQTTSLVTVQELDPIYVDIPESTTVLLRLKREIANGQIKSTGDNQAQVTLTLEDGSTYDQNGQLQFSEVTVDQGTGSVILRAVFPNPHHLLLPGMFVTAHLAEGFVDNGILVPQQGITHNQRGEPTALVVDPDNKVELRVLKTNRALGDKWLVSEGLKEGEMVIIEGTQKAAPGATVHASEYAAGSAPSTVQQN